jgi:hypothetical protein
MSEIADYGRLEKAYFRDDTLRTLGLFARGQFVRKQERIKLRRFCP